MPGPRLRRRPRVSKHSASQLPVNRYDFQKLARTRLEEARILLGERRYEGCYYLSGYTVECGLKACIAKLTKRYDFPEKNLADSYNHDLIRLLKLARLEPDLDVESKRDNEFSLNWSAVKEWNEQSRYELTKSAKDAESIFNAVSARRHGVLRWIKKRW